MVDINRYNILSCIKQLFQVPVPTNRAAGYSYIPYLNYIANRFILMFSGFPFTSGVLTSSDILNVTWTYLKWYCSTHQEQQLQLKYFSRHCFIMNIWRKHFLIHRSIEKHNYVWQYSAAMPKKGISFHKRPFPQCDACLPGLEMGKG